MTDETYPDYLQLRTGQAPPPDPHEAGVRVYADDDGALRSLQSDGTDAPVGGGAGGLQTLGPFPVTEANLPSNGDYLHLCDLDAGQVLLNVYAVGVEPMGGGSPRIGFAVGERGNLDVSAQFGANALIPPAVPTSADFALTGDLGYASPVVITGASEFVAYLDSGTISPNGAIDVYLLVAT